MYLYANYFTIKKHNFQPIPLRLPSIKLIVGADGVNFYVGMI